MCKYLFLIALIISSISFAADIDYSKLTPFKIEQDLANCPTKAPHINLSCEELRTLAARINDLAIQLQFDRQGYGKAILAAQEKLARQQQLLAKNKNNQELFTAVAINQQEINERLLLIRWLESPR